MAAKNVSISLSANTNYEIVESVLKITGKTVYGKTVTATTAINQAAVAGSVAVSIMSMSVDNDGHVDGASGEVQYSVGWTGLKTGTTINLAGTTGMSNITPSSITVNRVSSTFPQTVTVNRSALSSGSRNLTLTASGTDANGTTQTGSATYVQHGVGGTGGSDLVVSAITTSPVAASTTSVTFSVAYSNVWGDITLTPSFGTASPATISAAGSGTTQITVTVPANDTHSPKDIKLTASTTFNNLSDDATIVQSGLGYNPSITPATTSVTLAAYVDGAYDGSDVSGSVNFTYTELSGYTVSKTSGIKTATVTTGSTNTVRFTVVQNETTSAISPVGTITVTGKGQGGTDVTMVITVNQSAGVTPQFSIDPATKSLPASGTSTTARLDYNYVKPNSIASASTTGNITSVSLND